MSSGALHLGQVEAMIFMRASSSSLLAALRSFSRLIIERLLLEIASHASEIKVIGKPNITKNPPVALS